ncbi:peptidoglycan recognition family protein [Streptomyces enissocaesilis]|uniref:N-acetylmuramoyl-L-alanine amidase n=1 Tax=Streptomyces enissocaesilis TaxID=332589 RepID=A0ABN3XMF4_9ACTN
MATPLTADQLLAALRTEGVTVVEHDGWRTHNRNHVGAWGPVNGVMIHHTVSSGTTASVELCYNGYEGLPGPLCHGVIDKDGTVYLVGNGRANHAGGGDPDVLKAVIAENYGDRPPTTNEHQGSAGAVDGNTRFYGFECVNLGDGADPWPAAQLDAVERVSAAICRVHAWTSKSVIGHLEWSDWKSDPRGVPMPGMRTRIASRLAATPPQPPAS